MKITMLVFGQVFGDLAQSPLPILTPSIATLMPFLLEVAVKPDLDVGTQNAALYVVSNIIQSKPKAGTFFLRSVGDPAAI